MVTVWLCGPGLSGPDGSAGARFPHRPLQGEGQGQLGRRQVPQQDSRTERRETEPGK